MTPTPSGLPQGLPSASVPGLPPSAPITTTSYGHPPPPSSLPPQQVLSRPPPPMSVYPAMPPMHHPPSQPYMPPPPSHIPPHMSSRIPPPPANFMPRNDKPFFFIHNIYLEWFLLLASSATYLLDQLPEQQRVSLRCIDSCPSRFATFYSLGVTNASHESFPSTNRYASARSTTTDPTVSKCPPPLFFYNIERERNPSRHIHRWMILSFIHTNLSLSIHL
jgi:hypothetical protein